MDIVFNTFSSLLYKEFKFKSICPCIPFDSSIEIPFVEGFNLVLSNSNESYNFVDLGFANLGLYIF